MLRRLPLPWIIGGAAAVVAVVALVLLGLVLAQKPKTIVVTRTSQGFVPQTVTIHKGDTIRFVTTTGQPFWPASNNHPTHTLYPEFDPKQPVAATSSWSFTFERAGVWGMHDHLAPQFTGTVVVQGYPGEAEAACLKVAPFATIAPSCWEADLTEILAKKGVDGAFAYVDKEYATDPQFRTNCHDVMHLVGAAAYQDYEKTHKTVDNAAASYCGYGFYHGFIETMQAQNGPGNYAEARQYCLDLRASGSWAAGACFHGIGHAIFDSLDGSLWGNPKAMVAAGLHACTRVIDDQADQVQCASGIFNSFANAMSAQNYVLSYDRYDPAAFCNAQEPQYQQACYGETGVGYFRNEKFTRAQALAYIHTLKPDARPGMIFNYFADEAKRSIETFDAAAMAKACMALPGGEPRNCVQGVLEGVREESPAQKSYVLNFPFCTALPAGMRSFCVTDQIEKTPSSERTTGFLAACRAVPEATSTATCASG